MNSKATIFIGDSAKIPTFLSEKCFDLVISGPPYWNEVIYSQDKGQLSMIADYGEFLESISKVWQGCVHTLKDGGILAIWIHDFFRKDGDYLTLVPFHGDLIRSMPPNLKLRHIGVWDRYLHKDRGPVETFDKVSTRFQYFLIFQKSGRHPTNNGLIKKSLRELYWNPVWTLKTHPKLAGSKTLFRLLFELKRRLSFLDFLKGDINKSLLKDDHVFKGYATECPEEISAWLISKFTQPGDKVLDPFLGSGTSMKSAINLNRSCVGIEINKKAVPSIENKLGFSPELKYIL